VDCLVGNPEVSFGGTIHLDVESASRRSVPERDGNSGERRWAALQNEE